MTRNRRLVFAGSGGQGVITAAIILAEAAVIHEGINATQSQSYGAAARGGITHSDVIISNEEIFFPYVTQPEVLICLTQEAYIAFSQTIYPGGILLTDPHFVTQTKMIDARQVELPMYDAVMDRIGKPIVFNICVLGTLLGLTELLREESLAATISEHVPKDFLDINMQAFQIGLQIGRGNAAQIAAE